MEIDNKTIDKITFVDRMVTLVSNKDDVRKIPESIFKGICALSNFWRDTIYAHVSYTNSFNDKLINKLLSIAEPKIDITLDANSEFIKKSLNEEIDISNIKVVTHLVHTITNNFEEVRVDKITSDGKYKWTENIFYSSIRREEIEENGTH